MKLYHGSPKKLDVLKPKLDSRTGVKGVWLTDIKEHAMIYALLENSSKTNVEWRSHKGKFTGADVESKEHIFDSGFLYIIEVDESGLECIKEHSWTSKEAVIPESIKTVKREQLEALNVTFVKIER